MGNLEFSPDKVRKEKIVKVIVVICIVVAIFVFSIIFSLFNGGYDKIHKNVYIQNVSVSGMSQEGAKEKLSKIYETKKLNKIILKHNDFEMPISYDQLGVTRNFNDAVDMAYGIGRKGNIFTNNYRLLLSGFLRKNINLDINIDDVSINNVINDVQSKLPDVTLQSSYYIDGSNLVIKKGTDGVEINRDELKSAIIKNINDFNSVDCEIEIPVIEKKADDIDIKKIADEIKKEPKDAYITKDPLEVHVEQDGVELACSLEDAQKIIDEKNESNGEYIIPLKITHPSVTVESLGNDAFANRLATYTTNYDASNVNRNNNLVLASEKLNGTIVKPGEEFSYNKTIGERTIASGFKEAKAYAGGKVVLDVGGGICQLSSTLYNAALLTNLDITERHNHYFLTSYVPAGRDATVSWGSVDFKFKNNRKYPIKIESKVEDGVATVSIYGIKQDDDNTVLIDSKVTSIIPKKVEYVKKSSGVSERSGEDGATSETYKTLLKNGVIVSKTLISTDTYNALSQIILQ